MGGYDHSECLQLGSGAAVKISSARGEAGLAGDVTRSGETCWMDLAPDFPVDKHMRQDLERAVSEKRARALIREMRKQLAKGS